MPTTLATTALFLIAIGLAFRCIRCQPTSIPDGALLNGSPRSIPATYGIPFSVISPCSGGEVNEREMCDRDWEAYRSSEGVAANIDASTRCDVVERYSTHAQRSIETLIETWEARLPRRFRLQTADYGFSNDANQYCFKEVDFERLSLSSNHNRTPSTDRLVERSQSCFNVLFNRIRFTEQYFALNEDEACHIRYEQDITDFMRHHLKPLSCNINQLMASLILQKPLVYQPTCTEIIDDINSIPLQSPPKHATNDAGSAASQPQLINDLRLFSTYRKFISFVRSYFKKSMS